jgi:pseudomonalisin
MKSVESNGRSRLVNTTELAIPQELGNVVASLASLHSFSTQPLHKRRRIAANDGQGRDLQALSPADFAGIYNLTPVWNGGTDGTGQSIAIIGRAVALQSDFDAFRAHFGLPPGKLEVITVKYNRRMESDDDQSEAAIDVQWASAVARNANIKLIASTSSTSGDGIANAIKYAVDNNVAPVISVSFGLCETYLSGMNAFYQAYWRQAAAQGITVVVAAGDNGSAGCDAQDIESIAVRGFAVNGLASTAYNVAVGGTQFDDGSLKAGYSNEDSSNGYVPEVVWNASSDGGLWAASGGVSTQTVTPAWQTGRGVPQSDPISDSEECDQHHRYVPDVSLSADGYQAMLNGELDVFWGTSLATPAFAGIMALVNQRMGVSNGLPNSRIYGLAVQAPGVFHDVVSGTNSVPCANGSRNCLNGTSTGFQAGPGFDLATGWGSIDINAFVNNWTSVSVAPEILALSRVEAKKGSQRLTIAGSAFQAGDALQVVMSYDGGSPVILRGRAIVSVSPAAIEVWVSVDATERTWNVQVINPNGQGSNLSTLVVKVPSVAI